MDVVSIGSGHKLRADAAASYQRMRAAGMPAGVTSSYRTPAEQQALRDAWVAHVNGTGPQANYALPPDESDHVRGTALDLPWGARVWVEQHGQAHGWHGVTNEKWHKAYNPTTDTHQEDEMELTDKVPMTPYSGSYLGVAATNVQDALAFARAGGQAAIRAQDDAAKAFANTKVILAVLSTMTSGAVDVAKITAAVDKALADLPDQIADELANRMKG